MSDTDTAKSPEEAAADVAAEAKKATGERRLAAVNAAASADTPTADDPTGGITDAQAQDATDWFLSDEEEEAGWQDFELQVSNKGEKWVRFRVSAMLRERINEIKDQNRQKVFDPMMADGKGAEVIRVNEAAANLRIAAEGLLVPDLKDPAVRRFRGEQFMDPADALRARFAHKPGLIDQIAGWVIDTSGYNDEDAREVRAGKS